MPGDDSSKVKVCVSEAAVAELLNVTGKVLLDGKLIADSLLPLPKSTLKLKSVGVRVGIGVAAVTVASVKPAATSALWIAEAVADRSELLKSIESVVVEPTSSVNVPVTGTTAVTSRYSMPS